MANDYEINYANIPELAVAFTRAENFIGGVIRFVRGGFKGVANDAMPNHALLITADHGQLFAVEETGSGLTENSLEKYRSKKNKIVAVMYWTKWNDAITREYALNSLAYIRRKQGDQSTKTGKYDWKGLLSFVPLLKKMKCFRPSSESQWCSENVASVHKNAGAAWIDKTEVAPDQLLKLMKNSSECSAVVAYYK